MIARGSRTLAPHVAFGAGCLVTCSVIACSVIACSAQVGSRPTPIGAPLANERSNQEGDLLVVLRPTIADQEVVAALAGEYEIEPLAAWRMESLDRYCVVFKTGSNARLVFVERRLAVDHRVEMVERNQLFQLRQGPTQARAPGIGSSEGSDGSDPYSDLQYAPAMMAVSAAHEQVTGRGITIGVIDTGADVTHPELAGRIAAAKGFVRHDQVFTDDRHGTAVAGVMVAATGNGIGIVGVAPEARLEVLKACWYPVDKASGEKASVERASAVCSSYTLALALDYAATRRIQVLNLSVGGPPDPLLDRLVENMVAGGTVVVGAVSPGRAGFPTDVHGVISVRACDSSGALWPADGPELAEGQLVAPGVEIMSLAPRSAYDFFSGESLAAAHVSGLVALLLEARPGLSAGDLLSALRSAPSDGATPWPIVNACAALNVVRADTATPIVRCSNAHLEPPQAGTQPRGGRASGRGPVPAAAV